MPFRVPAACVLGPRPDQPQQQAFAAQLPSSTGASTVPPSMSQPWDHSALLVALNNIASSPAASTSEWYFDTGASSHMSSTPAPLHSFSHSSAPSSILVGNGASLPVTSTGVSSIPTPHSALHLNNVLVSPHLIKNLVSVRALTRDNAVTVEFDSSSFSIKDLHTREVILRCESNGDLYPLRSSPQLLTASTSLDLWHQRLGHPGRHISPLLSCII